MNYALGTRRKRPYEWVFNKLKHDAKIRGIRMTLIYEELLAYTTVTKCEYCWEPLVWNPHMRHVKQTVAYNLDRTDSAKGYVTGNITPCCPRCNKAKGALFTYEEWYGMTAYLRGLHGTR